MNVKKVNHITVSLLIWICASFVAESGTLVLGDDVTNRFTCSQVCSTAGGSNVLPLNLKTRSRLECGTACSKRNWCQRYVISGGARNGSQTITFQCALLVDSETQCPSTSNIIPDSVTCVKVNTQVINTISECDIITQKVLNVKKNTVHEIEDYTLLQNLLAVGNELRVQVYVGTSRNISPAISIDIRGSETCVRILDSTVTSNSSDANLVVRDFCVGSNQDAFNVIVKPPLATPHTFSWTVQRGQRTHLGNNKVVFITGGNSSKLESALGSGYEVWIQSSGPSFHVGVIRPDVISQSKVKASEIAAQITLFEHGQYIIVSHFTNHSSNVVLLDLLLGKENTTMSDVSEVRWLADPCWSLVYSSNSVSSRREELRGLRNVFESGGRMRVRFEIDDVIILATPDFVGVDSSDMIVTYIPRVLSQSSALGNRKINLGGSNHTIWTHYYVASNGFVSTIDSVRISPLTDKAVVHWYAETTKYNLVYSSSSSNSTSLAKLVDLALTGRSIRVKVDNGTTRSLYSCHMIRVINNGQDVQCQVNGQLLVNFIEPGPKGPQPISLLSFAANPAECFQTVVLLAFQGSVEFSLSCHGALNSTHARSTQPQNIEWFVVD